MEAKELAVSYPAVQNAVNVDVVGLWEEKENGLIYKKLKASWGCDIMHKTQNV